MPPEVLLGHNESTPKIDIWSLGIILYGLVVGETPFRSHNKEELKKIILEKEIKIKWKEIWISKMCEDLILKLLNKDPNLRISMSDIFDHPWIANYRKEKFSKGSIL